MPDPIYNNNGTTNEAQEATHGGPSNDLLLYIARNNVTERRRLIKHVLVYVLVWAIVLPLSTFNFMPSRQSSRNERARASETATAQNHIMAYNMLEQWGIPFVRWSGNSWYAQNPEFFWGNVDELLVAIDAFSSPNTTVAASNARRSSQAWHFTMGVLTAWGIWILVCAVKILRKSRRNKTPKPPKPDPVALEYQRLMSTV